MAIPITVQVSVDKLAAMESVKEMIRDAVFQYSEWLDSEGLVVGHTQSGDTRSHEGLVRDFFTSVDN
jgi:hypothetical protein